MQLLGLGVVVAAIHGFGIATVPIRGEESRWARVAQEMIDSGDWIAPRQQGKVFPDRPPLNSWCIAATSLAVGDTSPFAVRLPTVLATVLTALLVALFARGFLGSGASLAAGLIYATFPQILQLGRFAESDSLMTLFIAGSLFVWHYGYMRGWPPWLFWTAGYSLAALAALTKGPQGPIYFVGATCLYLVLRRDWRRLFSWGHFCGVAVLLLVISAWQIPFTLIAGADASLKAWSEEGALAERLAEAGSGRLFSHLLVFPLQIVGVMLPWAFFGPPLATRDFWRRQTKSRDSAFFLLVVIFVILAPCWVIPSARVRYVMALFPAAACLFALGLEDGLERAKSSARWLGWNRFHGTLAVVMAGFGVLAITVACTVSRTATANVPENLQDWLHTAPLPAPAILLAFGFVAIAAAMGSLCLVRRAGMRWPDENTMKTGTGTATNSGLSRATIQPVAEPVPVFISPGMRSAFWAVLPAAAFLCAGYDGPVLDYLTITNPDAPRAVAEIKAAIPAGETLASFGPVYHLFTYSYRGPVELRAWPSPDAAPEDMPEYFCFMQNSAKKPRILPFPWEKLGEVVCDRYRMETPRVVVVVGRRVAAPQLANIHKEHK